MPVTYSITSANNFLTEDYDRLNISVNGSSTDYVSSWHTLVLAVKGSALPSTSYDIYKSSSIQPLGGNAGSLE